MVVVLEINFNWSEISNTYSNKILVIDHEFDLQGEVINVPENCTLKFRGGRLGNGKIVGNNTKIEAGIEYIFEEDIELEGSWVVEESYPQWFGAIPNKEVDSTSAIHKALFFEKVKIPEGVYCCNLMINDKNNKIINLSPNTILVPKENRAPIITILKSHNISIVNGELKSSFAGFSRFISINEGSGNVIDGVKLNMKEPVQAPVDSISYSKACIVIEKSNLNYIKNCHISNMHGSGVLIFDSSEKNTVQNNYIEKCITGILNNGDTTSYNSFIDNIIGYNDISGASGADGIFVNATSIEASSEGHIIKGNKIYNSGEHGMYIQASDTLISNNIVYSNHLGGIKLGKCRNVVVDSNVCYKNDSNIQVQSGYDIIVLSNNTCRLARRIDLDFTYDKTIDSFGGRNVSIINNRFETEEVSSGYSADLSGESNMILKGNFFSKSVITTYIGDQNGFVIDGNIIKGKLTVYQLVNNSKIINNSIGNFEIKGKTSGLIFEGNSIENLRLTSRKDVKLNCFKTFSNNIIFSDQKGGSPIYELFNGQDSNINNLIFNNNRIEVVDSDLIIINNAFFNIAFEECSILNNVFINSNKSINSTNVSNSIIMGNIGLSGVVSVARNSVIEQNIGTLNI